MRRDCLGDGSAWWAAVFLLLAFVHHLVHSQPQVYFKASLPAKSLPRIGRRSGGDGGVPFRSPIASPLGSSDVFGNDPSPDLFYSAPNYNPHPDAVLLLRRFLAEQRQGDSAPFYAPDSPLQPLPPTFFKYPPQDTPN